MKREIARTPRITANCSRRERQDGITRSVPDGTVSATIVLEVDAEALLRKFGDRALHSKGGKAIVAGGLVTVRALNRKREGGAK